MALRLRYCRGGRQAYDKVARQIRGPQAHINFLGFEELELPTTANPDSSSGLKRMTENPENPNGCTSVSNKKDVVAVGKCGVVVSFNSEKKPFCPAVVKMKNLATLQSLS